MKKLENENIEKTTQKQVIDFYTENPPKILTRGTIKQSTLNKILEDINANCKKKK